MHDWHSSIRHRHRLATIVAAPLAGVASAAFAGTGVLCEDMHGDAGSLPSTALAIGGGGGLGTINGRLSAVAFDDLVTLVPDLEDMYLVQIVDPAAFFAQTVQPMNPPIFDTSLWLFDPCAFGRLGNRSAPPGVGTPFALLLPLPSDGIGPGVNQPGVYFLAISGGNREPASNFGPIFKFIAPAEISGPDGKGGGAPITQWFGAPAVGGYTIDLDGVAFLGLSGGCTGDIDHDGVVGGADLGAMLGSWGPCPMGAPCPADLDGNGVVAGDLGALLGDWGSCPPTSGTPCGDPAAGPCIMPHPTPGCSQPCCCTLVCQLMPACCEIAWDAPCVKAAMDTCAP